MRNIRSRRKKPGLLRQHLTSVRTAQAVSGAVVEGADLGSPGIRFEPGSLVPGSYEFDVRTAGSACLVLQAVLPALIFGPGPFELRIGGGTHNPFAPPFDFVDRVVLPRLAAMGANVTATLERHGFFPAGGGGLRVRVEPAGTVAPLDLLERGETVRVQATAIVARLPRAIAERELRAVGRLLPLEGESPVIVEAAGSKGPGNVLMVEVESEHVTEIVTAFGERRIRAEDVATRAVKAIEEYLAAGAPVGRHLADQLLVPMVLGAGGRFRTAPLSRHAVTNVGVIEAFLPGRVETETLADGSVVISVSG
jgi:RNA 3'-terminal phosphate cyclase (ATP)